MFLRAREFGIKLAKEKCRIGRKTVTFLGQAEGVAPDPDKVQAIGNMKVPSTQKGVRGLMGVLNFYRKFIPQMVKKVVPLTDMLKKGARVEWTGVVEQGVRKCISAMTKAPILVYPDFTRTFRVTTDDSAYALGRSCHRKDLMETSQ